MSYAIFFSVDNTTIRLPTNPEEVDTIQDQEIEEFDILNLGKISVPSSMELETYSFEVELPSKPYQYIETKNDFKPASFYITLLKQWRTEKKPILFTSTNGINDISSLVLIKSLQNTEKAGEEGDYYVGIELKQYKPYDLKEVAIVKKETQMARSTTKTRSATPPKPDNQVYTVIKGDTLWSIAKKYLGNGSRYPEIHKINQPPIGANPNIIYPGQKLKIPGV